MEEYLRSIGFTEHNKGSISKVFKETIVIFDLQSLYIYLTEGGDRVQVSNCNRIEDFNQLIFIVTGFKI